MQMKHLERPGNIKGQKRIKLHQCINLQKYLYGVHRYYIANMWIKPLFGANHI